MMHKTFAVTKNPPDLSRFRCHVLHDHLTGTHYVVHWPRRLQEELDFEGVPGLLHLPHIEDQATRLSAEAVAHLPPAAGVTAEHNAYQALLRLHAHYRWDNFHPHQ